MELEIHFVGLLANVDASISKITLKNGFKIENLHRDKALDMFSRLFDLPSYEILSILTRYACLNESDDSVYFISKTFLLHPENPSTPNSYSNYPDFQNEMIDGYLSPLIKLMRLYKEGNITIPYDIYYRIHNGIPKLVQDWYRVLPVKRLLFSLNDYEIKDFEDFNQKTKLPFNRSFLQLTFENFELSFDASHPNVEFLLLMICLEILFNPSDHELRNRISRNVAVLLGDNPSDSEVIYETVKCLYDKRSDLVHTGTSNINEVDLTNMRNYVRKSIKLISGIDRSKDDILKILNASGFGSRPFYEYRNDL